jgi:TolA-binding protein
MSEYMVNFYDDKSQAIGEMMNDLTIGQYDVNIIGNSTMPSNRWGEWSIYMEAYQAGLIDRTEALMKTDIFDKEGVLQRMDIVQQLQSQLQQAQEQIKNLSGDLQTAHRESIASRKRTEVEKFKGKLKEAELDTKSASKEQVSKLTNAVSLEVEKSRLRGQAQRDREKLQAKGGK